MINRDNLEDIYPLAPMQELMLLHLLAAPESPVLQEQIALTLRMDLQVETLRRAWKAVVRRHPILRTGFYSEGLKRPLQVVFRTVTSRLRSEDLRAGGDGDIDAATATLRQEELEAGFVAAEAPLARLAVGQMGEDVFHVIFSFHHIVLDRWSASLVLQDLMACYAASSRGEEPPASASRPYRDYIEWLQKQDASAMEAYWRGALSEFADPTPFPPPHRGNGAGQWLQERAVVDDSTTERLQGLVRQWRMTLGSLLQGMWALLLSRASGSEKVMWSVSVSARPAELPGAESMIGLFTNNLPVGARVDPTRKLSDWLAELHERLVELRRFEHSSPALVQEWSGVRSGRPPESLVVVQNEPELRPDPAGPSVDVLAAVGDFRSNYPVSFMIEPGREIDLVLACDSTRLPQPTAQALLVAYVDLLGAVADEPAQPLAAFLERLPILAESVPGGAEERPVVVSRPAADLAARPANEVEAALAEVWEEVLEIDGVTVHDRFWDLGGTSVLAVQSAHRLHERGILINPADMAFRSLRQLAAGAEVRGGGPTLARRVVRALSWRKEE